MSSSDSDTIEEEPEVNPTRIGQNAQNRVSMTPGAGAAKMRLAGMGNAQTMNDLEQIMVKKTVSKSTVLYCPFVNNARELSYNHPFAKITMGFLGKKEAPEAEKAEFWEEHKEMAHKTLNIKRSNISSQMRKKFIGKQA